MRIHERRHEQGFTLIELLSSIAAAGILMLTILSLMGLVHREWGKGTDVKDVSTEMAFAMQTVAHEIRNAAWDSITVSSWGDTLKVGATLRIYKDDSDNLIISRNGNAMAFLDEAVRVFSVEAPVITDTGDTLKTVAITLVAEKTYATDSTAVWITPRIR